MFLIGISVAALHGSLVQAVFAILGYQVCDFIDHFAKQKVLDDISGEESEWNADPEDPESEVLGNMSRRKLPSEHQIAVYRIGNLLRRML